MYNLMGWLGRIALAISMACGILAIMLVCAEAVWKMFQPY